MTTIDFKETPLSVKSLSNLSEWDDQVKDLLIANCVSARKEDTTSISTETLVKVAGEKVKQIEAKSKRRAEIESIAVATRSVTERDELKNMLSDKVMTEALSAARKTLCMAEEKQNVENQRLKEIEVGIKGMVDKDLWETFKESREQHVDDRMAQVLGGIKAIKERLIIAPGAVMNAINDELLPFRAYWTVNRERALVKVWDVNGVWKKSKDMAGLLKTKEGMVTDNDAKKTVMRGIKAAPGDGNVTEKIQDIIDSGSDIAITWKEYRTAVIKALEDKTVRDGLESAKGIEEEDASSSFNATGGTEAMVKSQVFKTAVDVAVEDRLKNLHLGGPFQHQQPIALHASGSSIQGGQQQPHVQGHGQQGTGQQQQIIYVPVQQGQQHQQQ